METQTTMEWTGSPEYGSREAVEKVLPVIASPDAHSPEDLITAIAKILRMRGVSMEVLRDTCLGSYMRDLCGHSSVQVRSAACIAMDCFQTVLFDWADSVNWSNDIIIDACLRADMELRRRACDNARMTLRTAMERHANF